ncbi:MAG: hypothetical protein V2A63_00935, partial [Patescibacteria group bacterium]
MPGPNKSTAAAETIGQLKTEVGKELPEAKKTELKEKLDKLYEDKHAEKIYWSQHERGNFVKELGAQLAANKPAEEILGLIRQEIENELAQNQFDQQAQSYEDSDSTPELKDKNDARLIITNAWAENTKNLTPEQKTELQKHVAQLLNLAYVDAQHDIFTGVEDRNSFWGKRVTKAEAAKIAEFIKTEAKKLVDEKKPEQTPAAGAPKEDSPAAKIKEVEERLRTIAPNPEWAEKKGGKFPQEIPEKNRDTAK